MRLADFIRHNSNPIIVEWESFAKTLDLDGTMTRLQLRDHIDDILAFITNDLETRQTPSQQVEKSHGKSDSTEAYTDTAAELHGSLRHEEGFDIVQMVSEYRALRTSVVKLWTASQRGLDETDVEDLTRFNEAIDQVLAESVVKFTAKVDYSRDLLLGVLGHDLRSPLGAITMAGTLLPRVGELNDKQTTLAATIDKAGQRMARIIADLLDLARARQGTGLPAVRTPMDLGRLARQIADEVRTQHPDRVIDLTVTGDVTGEWDAVRMGQVYANLLGNAVQYGLETAPIKVSVEGTFDFVFVTVHNDGMPIPPKQRAGIFQSFTRGEDDGSGQASGSNLGLGLFITSEIVKSHAGTIEVHSTDTGGTSFTIKLPKHQSA